jgi:ribose transport system substrate-binding protein
MRLFSLLTTATAVFASAVALTIAAPGGARAAEVKAVYIPMDLASPYWVEVSKGLKAEGQKLGWDVQIYNPESDVQKQVSAMENYIAQGVSVIYLSALDKNSLVSVIKKAKDKGIPVITQSTYMPDVPGIVLHVGPDETDMGRTLGEAMGKWAKDHLTGKIKAVAFRVIQDPSTLTRVQGMKDGLTKYYPNVDFLPDMSGVVPEDGIKNMEALLQSNRDVNILMSSNDDSMMSAYQIGKSANLDLSKMAFGGVNAVPQALDLVRKSKADGGAYRVTVDITPFHNGEILADLGKKILSGEKVPSPYVVPAKAITFDNIGDYPAKK